PSPPTTALLANVAVLIIRLPPSAKIAPPRAPPPSREVCPPRQVEPKVSPLRPPVAPARWNVELVTVRLPRLYMAPPSAGPAGSDPLPPVPEFPPLAAVLSKVVLLMV